MATTTKKRKRAGSSTRGAGRRNAAIKKPTPSTNGQAKVKGSKDAPGQKFIEGTEPEKIPALDALVSKYTNFDKASKNAKESAADELGKIKDVMEQHAIEIYKTPYGDVTVQHGVTIVKVRLPKNQ